jgi:hypothetical protein
MSEPLLAMPNYVVEGDQRRMMVCHCKVCGTKIGEDFRGAFLRLPNYCEIKMQFIDGTNHVTNLCAECLGRGVTEDLAMLSAMYDADMALMVREVPELAEVLGPKLGPRVVAVDTKRRGIP